jgi:hypothetical protein
MILLSVPSGSATPAHLQHRSCDIVSRPLTRIDSSTALASIPLAYLACPSQDLQKRQPLHHHRPRHYGPPHLRNKLAAQLSSKYPICMLRRDSFPPSHSPHPHHLVHLIPAIPLTSSPPSRSPHPPLMPRPSNTWRIREARQVLPNICLHIFFTCILRLIPYPVLRSNTDRHLRPHRHALSYLTSTILPPAPPTRRLLPKQHWKPIHAQYIERPHRIQHYKYSSYRNGSSHSKLNFRCTTAKFATVPADPSSHSPVLASTLMHRSASRVTGLVSGHAGLGSQPRRPDRTV